MPTPNGPKNQPRFDINDDPDFAADLTTVSEYAALVGNRKTGTRAQRQALTGSDVWPGLQFGETDTGAEFVYYASGATGSWVQLNGTDAIYSGPPSATVQVPSGASRVLVQATVTLNQPQAVEVVGTAVSQISVNQTNNWAGNLALYVGGTIAGSSPNQTLTGGSRLGGTRRVGNLNAGNNAPVPLDRIGKAFLPAGSSQLTMVLSNDTNSSTAPFINNPQIEVWPA